MSNQETRSGLITAINPVIPVSNMSRTVSFYTDKLGFTLTYDSTQYEAGPMNYAVLCRDHICLHFQLFDDHHRLTMPSLRFVVSDIQALYDDFTQRSAISPQIALRETPWNTREFAFFDPDKVGLTFYQEL